MRERFPVQTRVPPMWLVQSRGACAFGPQGGLYSPLPPRRVTVNCTDASSMTSAQFLGPPWPVRHRTQLAQSSHLKPARTVLVT